MPLSQDDKAAFQERNDRTKGNDMVQIRKARRSATKLRLLLTGPSGAGKTYGGLLVAKGLGAKNIVVIDTEQGSSDSYDTLADFSVIDLAPPFSPERYIEAIKAAEDAGADCIIIDSISHEWNGKGGCLELVDEIAKAKFRGNTWSAYSEITPRHRSFIDAMLRSSAHIIATGRAKTETAQVDDGGRKKVVKLGMKLESRDGAEYEFTVCLDVIHDGHFAVASKDRTGVCGGDPKPITVETGRRLAEWLAGGHEPEATPLKAELKVDVAKLITDTSRAIASATAPQLERLRPKVAAKVLAGELTDNQAGMLIDQIDQRMASLTAGTGATS